MVRASAYFLAKDPLYNEEKPYTLRYEPHQDVSLARTNVIRELHSDLDVANIRDSFDQLSFQSKGFTIMPVAQVLTLKEFFDDEKVQSRLYPEVEQQLTAAIGAERAHVFEHVVRQRHTSFPVSTGEGYNTPQPTMMAHIDNTLDTAISIAQSLDMGAGLKEDWTSGGRFMVVKLRYLAGWASTNLLWMPLRGPLRDWPLMLCDASTIDVSKDLVPGDVVYPDAVTENIQIHYSPLQKWYFLEGQMPTEALVFKQADSDPGACSGVPHASFLHPDTPHEEPPRQSIEMRVMVQYSS